MMKSKWAVGLLIVALALGLVALLAGCGSGDTDTTEVGATTTVVTVPDTGQTFDLKFAYHTPKIASLVGKYLEPWTAAITEATGDRVQITHYAEQTLVKEEQTFDAITSGACDMALLEAEFNPGAFPISECGNLPLFFPSAEVAAAVYWDIVNTYAAEEWKDVKVLAVTVIAPAEYVGIKPVKVPADFAGLRMRTGGGLETKMIEALGATAVPLATSDLGTSLERKLVDGAFLSWSLANSSGALQVSSDFTNCDLFYRCWVLGMNKQVWESMPAAVQEAVMSASGQEASIKYTFANSTKTLEGFTYLTQGGGLKDNQTMYVPTAADMALWKTALAGVTTDWAATLPNGDEIVAKMTELITKYTPIVAGMAPAGE